jgi:predicted DNA-binding transcriptional regulator YafY
MDPHAALAFKKINLHLGNMLPESCLSFLKPYGKRAGEVLAQLENSGVAKWPKKIARISRHLTLEPPKIDRTVLSDVYDGLLLEKQLEVAYHNRVDNKTQQAQVHPLGLVFVDNVTYLVCTFWNYDDLRQIALHRIDSAKILVETARTPANFKLKEYIAAGNFDFPQSDGTIQLECLFDPYVAKHLEESPLNRSQKIQPQNDGQMLLTAKVEDTAQLRWWILAFGDRVEVKKPQTLRNDISEVLQTAALKYK